MARKPPRMLAIDTEDDSNGMVSIINFYDGRHHTTLTRAKEGEKLRERAWAALFGMAPATLWSCNAEYDLINLCGLWVGKMCTLQYVSGGLLRGSFRDAKITVFDTLRHWPMSVANMGVFLKTPKLDQDYAKARPIDVCPHGVLHTVYCAACVEYCRRDTEIVWHFAEQMIGRYTALGLTLKATLPSMAMQLFLNRFHERELFKLPDDVTDWMRGGYYGGRVEVYRFGRIEGPIQHYDVNSLFPSVMVEGTYPDTERWKRSRHMDLSKEGVADVTVHIKETEYPGLPMRGEEDIVYPHGTVKGRWCYPELRRVIADGGTIMRVKEVIEFEPMPTPFKEYIEFCYAERMKAVKHTLDDVLWKLYMNSLYGKFGQRGGLDMIYDDRSIRLETKPGPAANVVWAAYVTCLARLRLLDELRGCSEVYYTDTDSIFTPDTRPVSSVLGALKHEGTYAEMECFGNKLYSYEDATGPVYKAKGVPRAAAKDFIRMGRATYRKPARLRESRRSFATMNRWYEVTKEREAIYTKRRRLTTGRTVPWRWDQYLAHMEAMA